MNKMCKKKKNSVTQFRGHTLGTNCSLRLYFAVFY